MSLPEYKSVNECDGIDHTREILKKKRAQIARTKRQEKDFLFPYGKHKGEWLNDMTNVNYIEWYTKNMKLGTKNAQLFKIRLHVLTCKDPECCCACDSCLEMYIDVDEERQYSKKTLRRQELKQHKLEKTPSPAFSDDGETLIPEPDDEDE